MTPKAKLIIRYPLVGWRNHRARVMARKISKFESDQRYGEQFKNDYILKRAKKVLKMLNVDVEVIGYDNVPKTPVLLTPNHSSSVDPLLMIAALENPEKDSNSFNPKMVFIAKEEIRKNKRLRGYADVLHTFYIDRKNPRQALEVLNEFVEYAKEKKKHMIIFPEGTRSPDGELLEFHGGSFKIAKKAFLPIIPVTINNALSATDLQRKGRLKVQVIFHPIIKPMTFMSTENKDIAIQVQKIVQSKLKKPEGKKSKTENKIV